MSTEPLNSSECLDLNRLRWRAVWIPTLSLAALLTLDGILEYLLEDTWDVHVLLAHFLFVDGYLVVGPSGCRARCFRGRAAATGARRPRGST